MAPLPIALALLMARSVRRGLRRGLPRGELVRQLHEIGGRSLLLVVGGMMFFGAVMMAHGAYQARKVIGDLGVVGPAFFELMIREFGPTIAGILAAVRISAAISAELSAMQVTEQLDALRMSAGDPYSDLVLPRVLAGLIALPCLIIVGTMAATLVAAGVATHVYGADGRAFMDPALVDAGDLAAFFGKSFGYGLFIPLAACASGLAARGGPGAVGAATTAGVVDACVLVR
jgi:phospholipid/cholesterol/gamma-HCH transport system permease protein